MDLTGAQPNTPARMFVTNTLGNPFVEQEWVPTMYKAIGESRKAADKIKRAESIPSALEFMNLCLLLNDLGVEVLPCRSNLIFHGWRWSR